MMEDIEEMIDDCEVRSEKLTDWECRFIDDIKAQRYDGKELTPTQYEKLEQIWDKVTS